MRNVTFAAAAGMLLLGHYVFSFQRFTLQIARARAVPGVHVGQIQALMTPPLMGGLGWLSTVGHLVVAGLFWHWFTWVWAVLYLFVHFVIFSSVVPLFPLVNHFSRLALSELRGNAAKPDADADMRVYISSLEAEIDGVRTRFYAGSARM